MTETNGTPKAKRVSDPELQAIAKIAEVLSPLDERTRTRVVAWLNSRYGTAESIGEFADKAAFPA